MKGKESKTRLDLIVSNDFQFFYGLSHMLPVQPSLARQHTVNAHDLVLPKHVRVPVVEEHLHLVPVGVVLQHGLAHQPVLVSDLPQERRKICIGVLRWRRRSEPVLHEVVVIDHGDRVRTQDTCTVVRHCKEGIERKELESWKEWTGGTTFLSTQSCLSLFYTIEKITSHL